ncbi:hypothetical protein ACFQ3P_05310 [Paraburkholderia sabiae]|jgi:hypothetical protein|uniref:Uncharacterized protein n=1 Tax=Paraburkholderia sabiae TaxID=273251 RepID=A0ABU9QEH7_9BURK|nr:hypothetical protein [Paraburkholderia sabiae]WJZ76758.1 hypothetical protein QEN71_13465 [Paraburkholderia sabiae]CAD6546297.1 hypothetical protein LMG24235_04290 [Paraburkholderia sabiae]CAG9232203.1 conserved exported hypothetical protein [Paraburkholderia sabiae]
MFRTVILAAGLGLAAFMSQAAIAGQPAVAGTLSANSATATSAAASAAADKVYPPLPTLAMLPPSSGDEDEPVAAPKPTAKKRKVRAPVDLRPSAPAARLVVSETTRTYLRSVEKQLDLAMAK